MAYSTYFSYLSVLLALTTMSSTMASPIFPICCFPEMFEARLFVFHALVDVPDGHHSDGYEFINATSWTAYDSVNERTVTHTQLWMGLSLTPKIAYFEQKDIVDYKNNVMYHMYFDGCDVSPVNDQLYRECIPGNATLVSVGTLGNGVEVKTYLFRDHIYMGDYEIRATVMHSADNASECVPVRMTNTQSYDNIYAVDVTHADVVDVKPGIRNPAIFTPTKNCHREDTGKNTDESSPSGIFTLPLKDIRKSPSFMKLKNMRRESPPQPNPIVN